MIYFTLLCLYVYVGGAANIPIQRRNFRFEIKIRFNPRNFAYK